MIHRRQYLDLNRRIIRPGIHCKQSGFRTVVSRLELNQDAGWALRYPYAVHGHVKEEQFGRAVRPVDHRRPPHDPRPHERLN